jgi:sugar phosphate isomerase/epimerase
MDTDRTLMARWGCTTATFGGRLAGQVARDAPGRLRGHRVLPARPVRGPARPGLQRRAAAESGLRVSAYQALRDYEGMPVAHRDHVLGIAEQMMDQMAWLGADLLVLCANVHPDASDDHPRCVADLLLLAELAHSRGMRIAYEPIGWARHFADYRAAWELVREVDHPHLGLALDSLHVAATGLPLDGIAAIDPAKVFLAQLCDWPQTRLPPFEVARHYRLFPGEGIGPGGGIFPRVPATGLRGLLFCRDHERALPA